MDQHHAMFHTSGCGMVTIGCLQAGCKMVLVSLFDPHWSRSVSFHSDRVYNLTINERGFEWGADRNSAQDIRRFGNIPNHHELVLDGQRDKIIGPNDAVDLGHLPLDPCHLVLGPG